MEGYRGSRYIVSLSLKTLVDCVWNAMAHAQKPDFVFRRNGRVHLNLQGRQFSRQLAAKVCASAVVMLDTPRSEVVWEYWLPSPIASFPFTSPPVRHHVPSRFNWTLPRFYTLAYERNDFRRKTLLDMKMCVLISFTTSVWNISHSNKNSARYCQKCYPLAGSDLKWRTLEKGRGNRDISTD